MTIEALGIIRFGPGNRAASSAVLGPAALLADLDCSAPRARITAFGIRPGRFISARAAHIKEAIRPNIAGNFAQLLRAAAFRGR